MEFTGLSQEISRGNGMLWLFCFLLFGLTILLHSIGSSYWLAICLTAILLSQILVIIYWQDAKVGTIPNIIILSACLVSLSNISFNKMVNKERKAMLSSATKNQALENQLAYSILPAPVQKWLSTNEGFFRDGLSKVTIKQNLKIKLKPEQENWFTAKADQYFTLDPPAFNWSVNLQMNPIITIVGRDKFEKGKGEMLMKIFSIIPVVYVKENAKLDQSALQRYLAEIIWFPQAALSSYINWEYVDANSAKATLSYLGATGSGIFYFNDEGEFVKFTAQRYKEIDADAKPFNWVIDALEHKYFDEVLVPSKLNVTWSLDEVIFAL